MTKNIYAEAVADHLSAIRAHAAPDEGPRVLIAIDAGGFHVRWCHTVVHDMEKDEKVYHCDAPAGSASTVEELAALLEEVNAVRAEDAEGRT